MVLVFFAFVLFLGGIAIAFSIDCYEENTIHSDMVCKAHFLYTPGVFVFLTIGLGIASGFAIYNMH